jgi:hypothetical protein
MNYCEFQVAELFPVNGFIILEVDSVGEILCYSQVLFVHADGGLVPEQSVDISASVCLWCSKMTSFLDLVPGPCFLLDFGQSLVDLVTNGSEAVVI